MFKRTQRWPRSRSSACWLHLSTTGSTIQAGDPGLLQQRCVFRNKALHNDFSSLRCCCVSATIWDFPCTAKRVRSAAKRPWAQGDVEQCSPAKFHTPSPGGMKYWQVTCSSCIASSAKNASVIRKHTQGVTKSSPRGNKHLASGRESGRTWKTIIIQAGKGTFSVLCELRFKICFKICSLEGNQQWAVRPGKPKWHPFRERDSKMLKHSLKDVWKGNFPWKYVAVLWHAHKSPLTLYCSSTPV